MPFSHLQGDLVGVIGKVGSGKTLLLNAVLAEVEKDYGVVAVNSIDSGFAYVRQNPWLQRLTIRENILFGKNYEPNKYKYNIFLLLFQLSLIAFQNFNT